MFIAIETCIIIYSNSFSWYTLSIEIDQLLTDVDTLTHTQTPPHPTPPQYPWYDWTGFVIVNVHQSYKTIYIFSDISRLEFVLSTLWDFSHDEPGIFRGQVGWNSSSEYRHIRAKLLGGIYLNFIYALNTEMTQVVVIINYGW